jgi:tripartite-type tricarboxylate transporter receptor subunit TctC
VFGIKTTYVPFKGTGDMTTAVLGGTSAARCPIPRSRSTTRARCARSRRDGQRHPLLPDTPTFRELGVDWVDGAYRGIGVPKSTAGSAEAPVRPVGRAQPRPEMKELAAKSGFELVDVGIEQMDAFMKEKSALYTESAKRLGLGK